MINPNDYLNKCENCGKNELDVKLFWVRQTEKYYCDSCLTDILRIFRRNYLTTLENHPEKILGKLGFGERHIDCSFENYQGSQSLINQIKSFFDTLPVKENAIFEGKNGTGKTHLAAASIRYILQVHKIHYKKIEYVKLCELVYKIRGAFKDANVSFDRRRYETSWLLFIDDFAAEYITDTVKSEILQIIDYRYERKLPVIGTTDLDIKLISDLFGNRCASRLYSGQIFRTKGNDRRIKR